MAYLPSDNPASLIGWYRKGVGVTASGGFASAWADQSGNGNTILQATGVNQPAYDSNAGVLTFDGIAQWMRAVFTLNQPCQVSALLNPISFTSNAQLIGGGAAAARLSYTGVANTVAINAGTLLSGDVITLNTYYAMTYLLSGANSVLTVNGFADLTGNAGANNPGGLTLATSQVAVPVLFTNIAVKEVIVRNVDNASIRAQDQQYLIDLQNFVPAVTGGTGLEKLAEEGRYDEPRRVMIAGKPFTVRSKAEYLALVRRFARKEAEAKGTAERQAEAVIGRAQESARDALTDRQTAEIATLLREKMAAEGRAEVKRSLAATGIPMELLMLLAPEL